MMLATKHILALESCVLKENNRRELQHIHIKGNYAEATNGHIFARISFNKNKDEDFPVTKGESPGDRNVLVTPDQLKKAFGGIPKKPKLPILNNVKIELSEDGTESLVTGTDMSTVVTSSIKQNDLVYPDVNKVFPIIPHNNAKEIYLSSFVLKNLLALMTQMNSILPSVRLRIGGENMPITFYIPDGEYMTSGFKGVIMPIRKEEKFCPQLDELLDGNRSARKVTKRLRLIKRFLIVSKRLRKTTEVSWKVVKNYCELKGYLPLTGASYVRFVNDPFVIHWTRRK